MYPMKILHFSPEKSNGYTFPRVSTYTIYTNHMSLIYCMLQPSKLQPKIQSDNTDSFSQTVESF